MNTPPNREVALFSAALELPASKRMAYLADACADDPALRQRLEALLGLHEKAITFLENPPPGAQESPADAEVPTATLRLTSVPSEKAGDRIGRYKLLQQIGEGGCGVVYMAEQEEPVHRRVAVKVIKLGMDTKQVIARFEAERQALALMDHPNIAKVFDAGATDTGRPYFVMELVRGIKITEYCDQHRLSTEERLQLFTQVCQAIQHAHQKGIIHRDIKPSNILVTVSEPGAPGCPKVIDFGIAKATTGQRLTDKTVFTAFEQFMGTPAYMSPEQAMMTSLDIDTRTDIYALGVLLYELLTGQTPFDAKELMAAGLDAMRRIIREQEPMRPSTRLSTMLDADLTVVAGHRHAEPARLGALLRGDLDWIVMKCLDKDRARRYDTANGLASDVQRYLTDEPVLARPPSNLYRFQKLVRRNKLAFGAAGAVAAALVLGLGISTWEFFKEREARERAVLAVQEQFRLRKEADDARANERVQRSKAQADQKKAETEAAKSRQVADLLKKALESVGPSVALGRDTTMLREILNKTAESIGTDLTNQPEVELELRSILANTYHELGLYRQMEEMACRSLELARARPGEENEWVAYSLNILGDASMHLGNLDESEQYACEALALASKLLNDQLPGSNHWATAEKAFLLLASIRERQSRWAEAETLGRAELALDRELFKNEDSKEGVSLNNLAIVLRNQGKLLEAEIMQREALAMDRKRFGHEHPDIASDLDNLAQVLRQQGKLAEAETIYRDALAMRRKLLGKEHPALAISLYNLATVLSEQGKVSEAEALFRETLGMRRKLFGDLDPSLALPLKRLAQLLWDQGKLPEAEAMFREALGQRKLLGYEHADTADLLDYLANALSDQGKLSEAEALFREELALRRKLLGNEHPDVVLALNNLATTLLEQGKLPQAETLLREALRIVRNASAEASDLALVLHHLAEVLGLRMAFAVARPLAEEAVAMYKRHPDWPSREREHASSVLADILLELGDLVRATALYREELRRLHPQLASNDPGLARVIAQPTAPLRGEQSVAEAPRLGVTLHHLAEVLRERNELTEARSLAEEATAMYQRHPDWPLDDRQHAFAVLGDVLTDLGDLTSAEALYREQLQASRTRLAPDDTELAGRIADLTGTLLGERKFAEAESMARECLAIREKKLPDDWRTFNSRSMLGGALLGQKNYTEAESLLLSGYEGMEHRQDNLPPVAKSRMKDALQSLVHLFEATNRPEQAAQWKRKLGELADQLKQRESLAQAAEQAAMAAETRRASGVTHAQHGRFADAAADFSRVIELRPDDHEVWHWQAVTLVQMGQLDAYRELRRRSVELFGKTTDPNTAERIAKDFLILPCVGADLETAAKMVETAVSAPTNHPDIIWFQFAKGLAEYRQGHFAIAVKWMQNVLSAIAHDSTRDGEAWIVLAMAQHQRKQTDEAHASLAKGLDIVNMKMPKIDSGDLGGGWVDWIIAHALLVEAKALLEGQPATPKK